MLRGEVQDLVLAAQISSAGTDVIGFTPEAAASIGNWQEERDLRDFTGEGR